MATTQMVRSHRMQLMWRCFVLGGAAQVRACGSVHTWSHGACASRVHWKAHLHLRRKEIWVVEGQCYGHAGNGAYLGDARWQALRSLGSAAGWLVTPEEVRLSRRANYVKEEEA